MTVSQDNVNGKRQSVERVVRSLHEKINDDFTRRNDSFSSFVLTFYCAYVGVASIL